MIHYIKKNLLPAFQFYCRKPGKQTIRRTTELNSYVYFASMQLTSIARSFITSLITFSIAFGATAQIGTGNAIPSRQDSLRGSINNERSWWDVKRYDISVTPNYAGKTISGKVIMKFTVREIGNLMQIDLQQPMQLNEVVLNGKVLKFNREGNVYHVNINEVLEKGSSQSISLSFSGKPTEAIRPPWDGGWIWRQDSRGNPWMSVACQGLGASVWYPCKDHQSDEPENGASLAITVPAGLTGVGNGRLLKTDSMPDGSSTWHWEVTNPINNYNIIPYIGKYVHWSEKHQGEKGVLDLDYWVLEENLDSAKKQFSQVHPMMTCFESWFGAYPFYEDGYKLVESPHLGMEHQSAVAYGNKFKNGYLGRDLSGSGWGLKWDFIIIHETGHEWFGNNITTNDIADMWVHESFTNYSETLYTECQFGKEAGTDYLVGIRKNIQNDIPIIGAYGVNREGSGDMYYKGSNMIHNIRQVINDDQKFRSLLRDMNKQFYHQTVSSSELEKYISDYCGRDLSKIFDQYLRTTQVPQLAYKPKGKKMLYRWENTVPGFDMPVKVILDGKETWLSATTSWKKKKGNPASLKADRNFYISVKKS